MAGVGEGAGALQAWGAGCVALVQDVFSDFEDVLLWANTLADPHYAYMLIFPVVAVLDSVFAAQYLLVIAFGNWANCVMKWIFSEDRPYWWVRETDYYKLEPLKLRQFEQTCETGPGMPSGHSWSAASQILLAVIWINHVLVDRGYSVTWLRYVLWPASVASVFTVCLARVYIATHFPHQCIGGAFMGLMTTCILIFFVCDPYIWGPYPKRKDHVVRRRKLLLTMGTVLLVGIALAVYWTIKYMGGDPQWTIKMAFKWCERPENIKVSTTPLFALVEAVGSLLGWAVFVSPDIDKYRHNTRKRSLLLSIVLATCFHYASELFQQSVPTHDAQRYYAMQFAFYTLRALAYLRLLPWLSMLPFRGKEKQH